MTGKVLGVLAGLVVLVVAALAVAAAVLDANAFKPGIIEAVRQATGRTLRLNGPLRISRSLWPTIEVSDVALSNLAGGSRPDIARAERIEAALSLPSLLRGEIEVVTLTLTGPDILFEEVGEAPNWVFDPPASAAAVAGPVPGPAAAPGAASRLQIRAVTVRNGMVTWRFPARTKVVGIRSLEMRQPTQAGPLDMSAVLVYGDNQPFGLTAAASPTQGPTGGLHGPWTATIGFQAFDTTATATGTMDLAGGYDLQVDGRSGTLERLNGLLPEMHLPPAHQVSLSTRLRNGKALGELPVIGATRLQLETADLSAAIPGLVLGRTEASKAAGEAAEGSATVSGSGRFAGQAFTLTGSLGVPQRLDGPVSLPMDFVVKGGGAASKDSLAVKGRVALNALRFAGLDVAASLRTPALAGLRPVLTPALPALKEVRFDGRVVMPGDGGSVAFRGAKLASAEGDVEGDWTLGLQAGLHLDGKLASGQLDLDAMLAAFGVALPAAPALGGAAGPAISTVPLPWALLRGPGVALSARIGAMAFQGQVWRDVRVTVALEGGRLRVAPVSVAMPGGAMQMSLVVDASGGVAPGAAPVSLELHAPDIPLALIGRYAGLPGPMAGSVRVDAALHGVGRTPHELAATLEGPVSATMAGGQMTNAAFVMLTAASLEALGIKVPAQGETALRCMGLVGSFSKGVGQWRTIALDTTYLQLEGKGQVDFAAETVAFKLRPMARISGASVAVPVVVEGPFHAVRGRLDADGLDKLGLFLDGLFGGDRSTACADAGLVPGPARGAAPG